MNFTFIGMPASGKTTYGKEIAKSLRVKFIDIDQEIENKFKLKLPEIIERIGEKNFLKEEEKAVLGLKKINYSIISPGGSVIYSKKAMKFLKKISLIVFLKTPFKLLKRRIENPLKRGIIGSRNKSLKEICKKRLPLYKKYADIILEI